MRKLNLKINEKNYSLVMTRESIKWLEENGFLLEEFIQKPVTNYDLLWTSLFLANHKEVNSKVAIGLMETYGKDHKVSKVISFAIEEYRNFMNALADIDSAKMDEELEIMEA